jgi:hypothetical protein
MFDRKFGFLFNSLKIFLQELHRQFDVFKRGQGGQQVKELEDGSNFFTAYAGEVIGCQSFQSEAAEVNGTAVHPVNAAQTIQEGRFTATGRANERDAFPGGE